MNDETLSDKLLDLRENFSIKIITGLRGIGKTTLLKNFIRRLNDEGVSDDEIIHIDFEENQSIRDFRKLYEVVGGKIETLEHVYLLFDNIQLVNEWEKAVNAFFTGYPSEIYLTGTGKSKMTGELQKFFPDNIDVLELFPISYANYEKIFLAQYPEKLLSDYINFGGLPAVVKFNADREYLKNLLTGIYYETVYKDIVAEYFIRDAGLFDSLLRILARTGTKGVKPAEISDYCDSIGRKITTFTLEAYLKIAEDAGIIRRVRRYDIKADAPLNGLERIYFADNGILNAALNFAPDAENILAENAICLELLRRGYDVRNGRYASFPVSFAAFSESEKFYVQFLPGQENSEHTRLLRPVKKLKNYEKILPVSLNSGKIRNKVEVIGLREFLLGM